MELGGQDMVRLAREVAEEVESGNTQCDLRLDLPETLAGVWDGDCIQQMLSNLLGNAVRYSAPGTAVLLRAQTKGEQAVIPETADKSPAQREVELAPHVK